MEKHFSWSIVSDTIVFIITKICELYLGTVFHCMVLCVEWNNHVDHNNFELVGYHSFGIEFGDQASHSWHHMVPMVSIQQADIKNTLQIFFGLNKTYFQSDCNCQKTKVRCASVAS